MRTFAGNRDRLVVLTDLELVQHAYALVDEVDDDYLADEFYMALGEAFERFAPEASRAELEASYADDPNRDREVKDSVESMGRRAMLRGFSDRFRELVDDA